MKREPTQEEREKIVRALATGDRIRATSTYISITRVRLDRGTEVYQGSHHARIGESAPILGFLIQSMQGQLDRFQFQCADPL